MARGTWQKELQRSRPEKNEKFSKNQKCARTERGGHYGGPF